MVTSDQGRREILVPIDIYGIDQETLEALVMMAERLGSGLFGLFIRDMLLQQVAELPFTTEVIRATGEERALQSDHLERRSRELRLSVESRFNQYVSTRKISCRFDYAEGRRSLNELLEQGCDVFFPARRRAGPVAGGNYRRVKLVYDAGPESVRAVDIVHALIRNGHTREVVLIATRGVPRVLVSGLVEAGVRVYIDYEATVAGGVEQLLFRRPASDLLLLPRSLIGENTGGLESALVRMVSSVLVVNR